MRIRSFLAALLLVCSIGTAQSQEESAALKAKVEAVDAALGTGDPAAVAKLVTADFKFTDIFGKSGNAGTWIERNKAVAAILTEPMHTVEVRSVTISGEKAVLLTRANVTGTGKDRQGMEGPAKMGVNHRSEWVKDGGEWKMKTCKEVLFEGTANKRPLKMTTTKAEEDVRLQFQPVYGIVSELYEKKDWEGAKKASSADFVIIDMDGEKITLDTMINRVKAGAELLENPVMIIDPQQVLLDGDRVIVIKVMRLLADLKGQDGKRVVYINVSRDTFVKNDKNWLAKMTEELHAEATIGGMPVPLAMLKGKL
jgi:ketosteroid isomerase-like protein